MDRSAKSRRARLSLEGLEDRLALSHAALFPILDPGAVAARGKPILPAVSREASVPAVSEIVVTKCTDVGSARTLLSGFSVSSGGDRPTESLSLNFTKITYS